MQSRQFLLTLLLILLVVLPCLAQEEIRTEEIYESQVQELNIGDIEQFVGGLDREVQEMLPTLDLKSLIGDPSGKSWGRVFIDLVQNIVSFFFREVLANTRLMGQLLVLAVALSLLTQLQAGFGDQSLKELAFVVCYLVLILLGLKSFNSAIGYGLDAINNMVGLMQALLPTYTMLLVGVGAMTTAALLSPIMYGFVTLVSSLISRIVLPLLFFGVVIGLIGNISGKFRLTSLAGLFKQAATVTLGFLFTAFLGASVVRGVTAPVTDGVALRTTKFLAGSFVPVVGKMYSEAIEVVVGSSLILKNAVGILGIFLILLVCAFPMAKIIAVLLVYKFVNAIVEPISDSQFSKGLNQLVSGLTMLFVVVATVSIFFFISLTIIISASNVAVMMRG